MSCGSCYFICLSVITCVRGEVGGMSSVSYTEFSLKPPSEENSISCQETVISPTHVLRCLLQTTFYMPGVYTCDLLKSLAGFHNLCCPSVLAACINFSDALSLLSKSLWKIIRGTLLGPGHSAIRLLRFPGQALRWQGDTAEEKSQPARCEITSLIVRN